MDERRKRSRQVKFRLTDDEYQTFQKKVALSGLSTRAYLTKLIGGEVPKAAPPDVFWEVLKELRSIGNNLNQIAKLAHSFRSIRATKYDKESEELKAVILRMMEHNLLPTKTDTPE